jgi:hypothetical protein
MRREVLNYSIRANGMGIFTFVLNATACVFFHPTPHHSFPLHPHLHLPIPCACLDASAPARAQYRHCAPRATSPMSTPPANAQPTWSRQLALRCLGVVRAILRAARLSFASDGCAQTLNVRFSDTSARARFTSDTFLSASQGSSVSAIKVLNCDSPGHDQASIRLLPWSSSMLPLRWSR